MRASIPVDEALNALVLGAVDAAEDRVAMLHAVADDADATMRADRRERGNRAFERVEHERAAAHGDLEALVVTVAALRAFAHGVFGLTSGGWKEPTQRVLVGRLCCPVLQTLSLPTDALASLCLNR